VIGSLEVAGFSTALAIVVGASTWRFEGDKVAWTRTAKARSAYRETDHDENMPIPRLIEVAQIVAWVIVALSVLHALFLVLLIVAQETISFTTAVELPTFTGESITLPPPRRFFDVVAAVLYGIWLIATASVIGAFARWAKDAAKDVVQARRLMPIFAAAAVTVVAVVAEVGFALHTPPDRGSSLNLYPWPAASVYVGAVLAGAAVIAECRRAAPRLDRAPESSRDRIS
jgi:nitrate reductase gamma subunit